jgi:hypothetical protein
VTYPTEFVKTRSQFGGKVSYAFDHCCMLTCSRPSLEREPDSDYPGDVENQGYNWLVLWMYGASGGELVEGGGAVR